MESLMQTERTNVDSIPLLLQERLVTAQLNLFKELQNAKL